MPIVLAVFTAFGLIAALLGHGGWHLLAWSALLIVIAMPIYKYVRQLMKNKTDME
jgi:uncharacterized membrane protein (DUF2068 family)